MKIYILTEYRYNSIDDTIYPVGYYATKELAREGAKELYQQYLSDYDVDFTFDEYWNRVCDLEEADLVTDKE